MLLQTDPLSALLTLAPSPARRSLHAKQKAALAGAHRFRAWLAGRRAGKSYAAAVWLLGGAPGQTSLYCARTLKSAKAIMLATFADLNNRYRLNLDIRGSTGTITEPNGHVIQLCSLHDQGNADLLRGFSKIRRVFIDECGAFHDDLLRYSTEQVLQPMLLDCRGDLCLAGTPSPAGPRGYFYELTGNPGLDTPVAGRWQTSHWTFKDNPHIPGELVVAEAMTANGWSETSSGFLREYLGVAVEDTEAIVHCYAGERWAPVPASGRTVMAIDFGVVDRTAWVVCRQDYEQRPHVSVLAVFAQSNMGMPEIAATTRELRERWAVNTIVADEGALGKAFGNYLRDQHRLPVQPAPKMHKRARIDDIRGRCDAGTLHLCAEAAPLLDEWRVLAWNVGRTDYHESHACDLSDALGYALKEFVAYEAPALPPKPPVPPEQAAMEYARMQAMRRGNVLGRL